MGDMQQFIGRSGHNVDSECSVDLQVDEAGQDAVIDPPFLRIEADDAVVETQNAGDAKRIGAADVSY